MNKVALFSALFFSVCGLSDLRLEIKKGTIDPINIAIYEINNKSNISKTIGDVLRGDLIRTGEFKIIDGVEIVQLFDEKSVFNFKGWKMLNLDYVVIPEIDFPDNSSVNLRYRVFDVVLEKEIRASKIFGLRSNLRQIGHFASDGISESILGFPGVASTKIMYVNYSNFNDEETYKLFISDSDGFNRKLLLQSPYPIISPAWSPDSKEVAYVSFETGKASVYIQNVSTGRRNLVLKKNTQVSSPSWSPNGKFLAITIHEGGNPEIYILKLKDKSLTRLTNHYSIDTEANWSAKGNKIMFTSSRSGTPQLYEINLRSIGKNPKRITYEGDYNARGSYLPDGNGYVFVHRSSEGNFHIALKYRRESFARILTEARLDESPSVSPNGSMIVYAVSEDGINKLSILNINGAQFDLPSSEGMVREPAWSGLVR